MSEFDYPEELRYTSDHEWVRVGADGQVRIGITAYAQDALGDVVYVSLPATGDTITAGDACGEIESTKSVSDLSAPLSGTVTAVNAALEDAPELLNSDPYGEGWCYELELDDPAALDALMDATAYKANLG
ncbi:MAG: glycine cleavage system protein GcvH [Tetrasphaera sp.]